MVFGKLWATEWVCPACGCNASDATIRNCDECLLKFYFDNENASNFGEWQEPNKSGMNDEAWAQTAQLAELTGYKQGVQDVLVNLAEFVGQGGSIDLTNVEAWIATYGDEPPCKYCHHIPCNCNNLD